MELLGVHAAQGHPAALRVIEPLQQAEDGAFAGPAGPHQGGGFPGGEGEADVFEHGVSVVAEGDVLEFQVAGLRGDGPAAAHILALLHDDFRHTPGGALGPLDGFVIPEDILEKADQIGCVHIERDPLLQGDVSGVHQGRASQHHDHSLKNALRAGEERNRTAEGQIFLLGLIDALDGFLALFLLHLLLDEDLDEGDVHQDLGQVAAQLGELALDAVVPGEAHSSGEERHQEDHGEHDGLQSYQPPVIAVQNDGDAHQPVEGGWEVGDGPAEELRDEGAVGGGTGDEPAGHVPVEERHGQAQVLLEHQLLKVHLRLAGGDAAEDLADGLLQGAEEHTDHHEEDGPHADVAGSHLGGSVGDHEAELRAEETDQGGGAHPAPGRLDAGHQRPEGPPDAGLLFRFPWVHVVRHEITSYIK